MEFLELVKSRHSVRGYSERPVEEKKLRHVLECARLSPSARNSQVWRFVVVKDEEVKKKITAAMPFFNSFASKAPVIIVACAEGKSSSHNGQEYYLVDVAIALEHLVLAASEKGLGTCWMAAFDEEKVKEALSIPKEVRVVAITPLGYPGSEGLVAKATGKIAKLVSPRKKIEEIAFLDGWGERLGKCSDPKAVADSA